MKWVWLLFGLDYLLLPLAYAKSAIIFCIMLVFSIGIAIYHTTDITQRLFRLYLWSFSFFGISLLGLKLSDWVMLIALGILTFKKGLLVNKSLLLLLPFYIFIVVQCVTLGLGNYRFTSSMWMEFTRYILSLLTVFFFFQLRFKSEKVVKWMDYFAFGVVIQAVVMFVSQSLYSFPGVQKVGVLSVQVFADTSEARVSAFFSDPNKMMAFFLFLLIIRMFCVYRENATVIWNNSYWIYLIGSVFSLSRTSIISVVIFLVCYLLFEVIFDNAEFIGILILALALVLLFVIIAYFKNNLLSFVNDFFSQILTLFGRSRTVEIDSNVASDSRVEVWKQAIPYIKNNSIFGNGLLSEQNLLPIPTHNTIVQLLLDTGIFGLLVYIFGIILPIIRKIPVWVIISLLIVPMLFLDLANFRLVFAVLGLTLQGRQQTNGAQNLENNSID